MDFLVYLLIMVVVVLMGWVIDLTMTKRHFGERISRTAYREVKSFKEAFTK